MSFFADLRPGDGSSRGYTMGGKARSLVRLAERGLPTPQGFVVTGEVFVALCPSLPSITRVDEATLGLLDELRQQLLHASWPGDFVAQLQPRLHAVASPTFAVRSSFAHEDSAGQLAAGVYESFRDVPAGGVEAAIRQVFASALAPGAVAYALSHGARPAAEFLSVLVHAFIPGDAEGSAAFAPEVMHAPLVTVRQGQLSETVRAELLAAMHALAAADGATEIEWVACGEHAMYLQARPYQPPPAPTPWSGFLDLPEVERGNPSPWHWDAAHNPLPLSAAQAGLVALADENCQIGIRQRVLGSYLFYTRQGAWSPPALPVAMSEEFFSALANAVDGRLSRLRESPNLEDALSVFLFAYEPIFGVLQPALRKAHADLRTFLAEHAPAAIASIPTLRAGIPSMASQRAELAAQMAVSAKVDEARERYLAAFGDEAPIWDVSVPTYAEEPGLLVVGEAVAAPALDWQTASAEVEAGLAASLRETWRQLLGASRTAVALGEADDWLYARVQAAVRRALLTLGNRLVDEGRLDERADIFFVPLTVARELAAGRPEARSLKAMAKQARSAWLAAKANPPSAPPSADGVAIRGAGTGGRAIGRVRLHEPGKRADAHAVLVAATLLPTELPLVEALAIVTETGGPLDHVAAQARERRIPAVVGAQGAASTLRDGDLVLVDGDAGFVVRLGG